MVSPDDFHLILKKFMKDSYTVNYVAFVAYIDQITKHMDEKMYLDLGGVRTLLETLEQQSLRSCFLL
ncbi:hypothetical protein C0J52_19047 [Blattella germanica]|nr:hypothetical protein C0J52_19047 [Blattella germanica]